MMKKIWEFFENLNELVYVSDMDSHELIYMNKKARETYGFCTQEEVTGKKCYEVLQNCSAPCAICNNHELKPEYFKEWRHYNPLLKKHLLLKDTMVEDEGRRCRIEIAMDVSIQEQQSNMIRSYQSLETFTNEGLRLALQAPSPDKSINIILEYLGKALNGERTYIFEKNERGNDDNTYEWAATGVAPQKDNLQDLAPEICAGWYQNFCENKNIMIENLEDIREEDPLVYENLKQQNIHSLVVVPLYDEKKTIGFYGVDNPPRESLDYASNMLQILGHFIVSALKRRDLVKELQKMSYSDHLTKLGNRHALSEYIANMRKSASIGIVYCDVTGLKRVNDAEGHAAGDRLLLRASESLQRVFGNYGLFRIGGDEFLVMCAQIEEDDLKQRADWLKKDMMEHSVIIAVGATWRRDSSMDMESLMSEAEKLMYEDKSAYYRTAGIDRRR